MSGKRRVDVKLIAEKMADFFDIPTSALPWGMDMEIRNDRDLFIGGCTGISEYSENRIIFVGCGMKIRAEGEEFELFTFADGRVRLSGKIDSIFLERTEKNG